MHITKVKIKNFKCFRDFEFAPNEKMNIIVGDNNEGKSTILEAINICLTSTFRGKYLNNSLTQDLFNQEVIYEYIDGIKYNANIELPHILVELYYDSYDSIDLGKNNSEESNEGCISLKIEFDNKYETEYNELKKEQIFTLPIEYYKIVWSNSAGDNITNRNCPIKSTFIDTSENNSFLSLNNNLTKIIKQSLSEKELIEVSQAYRRARENFRTDNSINNINNKIFTNSDFYDKNQKKIEIDVEMLNRNDWEKAIVTKIDNIPFEYVGKGEQTALKVDVLLNTKQANETKVILIEEPENHLTHSKLNKLMNKISQFSSNKQMFICTHSSFVANKLGIDSLILLNNQNVAKFSDLEDSTISFFRKKAGFDTLRFLLCKKSILVEGDSDELIIQRAYMDINKKLPIEDEIDIISVGTSFLRFLEIAMLLNKKVNVVTDNDGDVESLEKKYKNYLGENSNENIKIYYEKNVNSITEFSIDENSINLNLNTLEPSIVLKNSINNLNSILGKEFTNNYDLLSYMIKNKTDCALKIFEAENNIIYPSYIMEAIKCD